METETYVLLAVRLRYLAREAAEPTLRLIVEISKMLTTLRQRLLAPEEQQCANGLFPVPYALFPELCHYPAWRFAAP